MKRWIIDTGPLVAYLDVGDPFHESVSSTLDGFTGRLHTTSAVITEAMHFLAEASGPELLVDFLISSGTEIFEMMRPAHLQAAVALMKKYADTPMDFADATLVLLAGELSLTEILTLDRRGFRVYRTSRGKSFRLVLT
ncbi:MAG: PIN domain-containing protein [Acidobacteria bacterium]|nr:PIN domain-containing protein [Acidobacteriota bacterium]